MAVFFVTTKIVTQKGTNLFFVIDCACQDMLSVYETLMAQGALLGSRLIVRADDRGGRQVVRREDILIMRDTVAFVQPYNFHVWEDASGG